MGGWNIIYALINFVILAGALFLIGRKMVAKALKEHRSKIQSDLKESAESLERVKSLDKHQPLWDDEHNRERLEQMRQNLLQRYPASYFDEGNALAVGRHAAKADSLCSLLDKDLAKSTFGAVLLVKDACLAIAVLVAPWRRDDLLDARLAEDKRRRVLRHIDYRTV